MHATLRILITLGQRVLILACLFSLTAFFGHASWLLDLTSHFRIQYLLIQLVCLGALLAARSWRGSLLLLPFVAMNLTPILPYYAPFASQPTAETSLGSPIKILNINVNLFNTRYTQTARYIVEKNPDILVIEEFTSTWNRALAPTLQAYPYRQIATRDDSFGLGLFSKLPLENPTVLLLGKSGFPSIVSGLTIAGQPTSIVATHPYPPFTDVNFQSRNAQLMAIAHYRPQLRENLILSGDLNTTPWSYPFQPFLQQTGLRDSQVGFGLQPSWPTFFVLPWIPIDHILVSPQFTVLNREIGPHIGSDHYPVYVEVALHANSVS